MIHSENLEVIEDIENTSEFCFFNFTGKYDLNYLLKESINIYTIIIISNVISQMFMNLPNLKVSTDAKRIISQIILCI